MKTQYKAWRKLWDLSCTLFLWCPYRASHAKRNADKCKSIEHQQWISASSASSLQFHLYRMHMDSFQIRNMNMASSLVQQKLALKQYIILRKKEKQIRPFIEERMVDKIWSLKRIIHSLKQAPLSKDTGHSSPTAHYQRESLPLLSTISSLSYDLRNAVLKASTSP